MKRYIIAVMLLALLLSLLWTGAEEETVFMLDEEETAEPTQTPEPQTDFRFEGFENGVMVTGRNTSDAKLVIPEMIEGKNVLMIAERAFEGDTALTEVVLPKTLVYIVSRAFSGCENLKSVAFQGDWTKVGIAEDAFPEGLVLGSTPLPDPTEPPVTETPIAEPTATETPVAEPTATDEPSQVAPCSIDGAQVDYVKKDYEYTGKPITFSYTVKYAGTPLEKDRDYAETWRSNTAAGVGCLILRGIGAYTGQKEIAFDIVKTGSGVHYSGDDVYVPPAGGTPEGDSTANTPSSADNDGETGQKEEGIVIEDTDIGNLLFLSETDEAVATKWTREEETDGGWVLSVAEENTEESAEETAVYLKIAQTQAQLLAEMDCRAVRYTVGEANVLLPLSLLNEEMVFTRSVEDSTSFTGVTREEFTEVPQEITLFFAADKEFVPTWEVPLLTDVYHLEVTASHEEGTAAVLPQKDGVFLCFDVREAYAVCACDDALDDLDVENTQEGAPLFADGYYAAAQLIEP